MKPMVTILTLSYRKFEHIFRTIDSVLNQNYPFIEYIISDDGSESFPQEKIEEYINTKKKKNICKYQIIHHGKNMGTVKNISFAWKKACGEILIPLSADDEFNGTNIITQIVERMEKEKADILVCSRVLCDKNLNIIRCVPSDENIKRIEKLNTAEKQFKAFASSNYYEMASGSVLYMKKEFLEKMGYFDEDYRLWEDGPFFVKCTRAGNKITTAYDIKSILYRDGGVSSGKKNPFMLKDMQLLSKTNSEDTERLSWLIRRRNKFLYEKLSAENNMQRFKVRLKYFDVCFRYTLFMLFGK